MRRVLLVIGVVLLSLSGGLLAARQAPAQSSESGPYTACETGCDVRGCCVIVYRWSWLGDGGIPHSQEMFDGQRFPTAEAAYCRIAEMRRNGDIRLPTLPRFGRDSNVVPESMTPMPHIGGICQ